MTYFMGIDGGGSTLRVVIIDEKQNVIANHQVKKSSNPSVIGHKKAGEMIHRAIEHTLSEANLKPKSITGVGVGIAGASATHSEKWLRDIIHKALPKTHIIPSSDVEIALVGAHGVREGIVVLAGTGSVAYGVNEFGEAKQVGGWGYLLGDEGSGYWIGLEALKAVARADDGRDHLTALGPKILRKFDLRHEGELIKWLYSPNKPPVRELAQLAPLVMETAEEGDEVALRIVEMAAAGLVFLVEVTRGELGMKTPRIAFSGALLENRNLLSETVKELMEMKELPKPIYSPVIGAALLAQIQIEAQDAN